MVALCKADFLRRQHTFHERHASVTDPLFVGSDFFDPRDLLLVKCEMLRRVRVEHWSVAAAARGCALARATFYEARRQWERGGLVGLVPQPPGPRGPHKVTAAVRAFLEEAGGRSAPGGAAGLAARLWREHAVRVHPRTIERVLGGRKKGDPPARRRGPTGIATTKPCAWPGYKARRPAVSRSWYGRACGRGCAWR